MPGVVFFDLSSKTGVAFDGPRSGVPITRLIRLPKAAGDQEDGREYGPVFATLRAEQAAIIDVVKPEAIGFEAAIPVTGGDSPAGRHRTTEHVIRLLFGFITVTEELAATKHVRCYQTHIATIKKHLTGSGRADKDAMIAACRQLGWDVGDDDNRADAAGGWAHLKGLLNKEWALKTTPLFSR